MDRHKWPAIEIEHLFMYRKCIGVHAYMLRCVAAASSGEAAPQVTTDDTPETVYYEGNGAPAELAISVGLGLFVIFLPLTIASVGRRLWIKYTFTNKRVTIVTDSPVVKRTVGVAYSQIKEVKTASRALGLWGDMVITTKKGDKLEIAGLERHKELQTYIEQFITP